MAGSKPTSPATLPSRLKSFDFFSSLDDDLIRSTAEVLETRRLAADTVLFRKGDPADAMYLVLSGSLRAIIGEDKGAAPIQERIGSGEMVGEIQVLAGGPRTATVVATEDTEVVRLPKQILEDLERASPAIVEQVLNVTRRRLRRNQLAAILPHLASLVGAESLREIEEQAEWVELARNQELFREGDPGESLYILVNGRLRATVRDAGGSPRTVGEIGQGEVIGEMAFFSKEPRTATISAVRNSMLIKITEGQFQEIVRKYPEVLTNITRRLITRLHRTIHATESYQGSSSLVVVPAAPDVPLGDFSARLAQALGRHGTALHLNGRRFDDLVGMPGAAQKTERGDPYCIRLNALLDEQEGHHRFLVLETDAGPTAWTKRCLQQADQVVVLARAGDRPDLGEIADRFLAPQRRVTDAKLTLVLLQEPAATLPEGTGRWLGLHEFSEHHHLRLSRDEDFRRLARLLSGNAVGLVLGGGGARGFAHIGVLRALQEAGIPVDVVGGTSMGAVISSQFAMGWSCDEMLARNRRAWIDMKPLSEYTLPMVSFLKGAKVRAVAEMFYGDHDIADLWLKYFCISSNISKAREMVHTRGSLRKAVQASASLPGAVVPVIDEGDLLIDGGLINNVPGDVMREQCGGYVIAVNVGSETVLRVEDENIPSPWEIAWSRVAPFGKPLRTISIFDVLLSATFIASDARLEQVRSSSDFYLRPPLTDYRLLDIGALDEINAVGYRYAGEELAKLQEREDFQRMMANVVGRAGG